MRFSRSQILLSAYVLTTTLSYASAIRHKPIDTNEFNAFDSYARNTREWEEIYENKQVNFTDELYQEYNRVKQTNDFIDNEVVLSADGSTLAVRGSNNNGDSFYAIYGTDEIRDQWTYSIPIEPLLGQTIPGTSISLSKDGKGTAIGGLQCNPTLVAEDGRVCYDFGTQRGPNDFDGDDWGNSFGSTVSLNDDSTLLAVGSRRGRVYVYVAQTVILSGRLSDARIGNFIEVGNQDNFGEKVKVVGTTTNPTVIVGGNAGKIAAYRYSEKTLWRKLGADIPATNDGSTFDVANSGNVIAVKSRDSIVRVYDYVDETDGSASWVQRGQNIFAEDGKFASLSLSSDGNIIAVGSYNGRDNAGASPGNVRLYEYGDQSWKSFSLFVQDSRLSNEVDFGSSISLSGNGKVLAVAAPAYNSINDKQKGYVAIYEVSDPFPSSAPTKAPSLPPTGTPTGLPTRSVKPSQKPVNEPTGSPSEMPTNPPTRSPKPSFTPSISFLPTYKPTAQPTPSTCQHDCECKEGSECDMSECRYNCNCEGGFCNMRKCEYDCRCKGGNCNMNRCENNCQCEMRGCQMDNCIYNTRCVANRDVSGSSTMVFSTMICLLAWISAYMVI